MKAVVATRGAELRWGVAAVVTAGFAVIAMSWFRVPVEVTPVVSSKPAVLRLARATTEAALLDKEPLFFPTEWNTSQIEVKLPESGGALAPYAWKTSFTESELKLLLPSPVTVPASAAEALMIPSPGSRFGSLGRSDSSVPPLYPRGAFLEVTSAGTGRRILGEALAAAQPPAGTGWQALEFLAAVDAAGLVALDLTSRSGVEEVDVYFSRYLAQTVRIGSRLSPGFYRICVGP